VQFTSDRVDAYPGLTRGAALATGAAGALALFGLPPVDLHGPLHRFGIMDPACGMTRAARALARADLATAWRYNPGSLALGVAVSAVLARAIAGLASGRWLMLHIEVRRRWLIVAAAALVALAIRQQRIASLLIAHGSGS
jgi:hypothetical protein